MMKNKILSIVFLASVFALSLPAYAVIDNGDNGASTISSGGGNSAFSNIAKNACNHAIKARHEEGERKKKAYMQLYKETVGKKLERLAKNCADALSRLMVPYANFDPSAIVNALIDKANQMCMQAANNLMQKQQEALSGFNQSLPFGIASTGTKTINVNQKGVNWKPVNVALPH